MELRVQLSYTYNIHLLFNLCRSEVEHSTIFICYLTCVDQVELVQMRGGTQYSTEFCHATCADEGWNTAQYLLCNLCK